MSIEQAKKIFAERYCRWCLEEWRRELKEGYPLLRASRCEAALEAIEALETLPFEERWKTAAALVRRKVQGKLKCNEVSYTEKDRILVQRYWDVSREIHNKNISTAVYDSLGYIIQPKIKRRHLRKAIQETVKPAFGEYEDEGGGVWNYSKQIGIWKIKTEFDTGGNFQLLYHHGIFFSEKEWLLDGISMVDWLGISGQFMWNNLSEADIESVSQFVAKIVSHFFHAASQLLEGLTPD